MLFSLPVYRTALLFDKGRYAAVEFLNVIEDPFYFRSILEMNLAVKDLPVG